MSVRWGREGASIRLSVCVGVALFLLLLALLILGRDLGSSKFIYVDF